MPRTALCFEADRIRLDAGGCVAVVGPNGAGKSSLLQMLAGALLPVQGKVKVHGEKPDRWSPDQRASRMAVLTQEEQSSPFRVQEVLAMGLYALPMQSGSQKRRIRRMMRALELLDLAERPLNRLSGGQQRRVHLARVLLQAEAFAALPEHQDSKPWILLDEPTDALDPRHAMLVLDVLRRQAKAGHGVLTVLHDLNLAAVLADRVLLLHEGRILADGSPAEILQPKLLQRAYGCPFQRQLLRDAQGLERPMVLPMPSDVHGPPKVLANPARVHSPSIEPQSV